MYTVEIPVLPLSLYPCKDNFRTVEVAIPFTEVAPGVWMKKLGTLPKDKAERKRAIREEMARRFPGLEVTLKTADALGILSTADQRNQFESTT